MELKPTLWRTCRVLANRSRLRILQDLMGSEPRTVNDMAARMRMAEPLASQYLRLLQSRGLLRSHRDGRRVWYSVQADPSVTGAAELIAALRLALAPGDGVLREIMRTLTGFTHPRRLVVLEILSRGAREFAELQGQSGISARALGRHLAKLCGRGLVVAEGTRYRLCRDGSPLAKSLLALATRG